jgi:hypothetical protein
MNDIEISKSKQEETRQQSHKVARQTAEKNILFSKGPFSLPSCYISFKRTILKKTPPDQQHPLGTH